nr:transcriptional regulator [Streptomyces sp. NBC_01445]
MTGGQLAEEHEGRHRYVWLADPGIAEMIEGLAAWAPHRQVPVRSLTAARRLRALALARVCYDHLAGSVAVAITDAMTTEGFLSWDYGLTLTASGARWLRELGIVDEAPGSSPRPHVRTCVDWTEQRLHLAGGVGAAVFRHAVEESWLVHAHDTRVVRLTDDGGALFACTHGCRTRHCPPTEVHPSYGLPPEHHRVTRRVVARRIVTGTVQFDRCCGRCDMAALTLPGARL